jgi:hypothetical protein
MIADEPEVAGCGALGTAAGRAGAGEPRRGAVFWNGVGPARSADPGVSPEGGLRPNMTISFAVGELHGPAYHRTASFRKLLL